MIINTSMRSSPLSCIFQLISGRNWVQVLSTQQSSPCSFFCLLIKTKHFGAMWGFWMCAGISIWVIERYRSSNIYYCELINSICTYFYFPSKIWTKIHFLLGSLWPIEAAHPGLLAALLAQMWTWGPSDASWFVKMWSKWPVQSSISSQDHRKVGNNAE